MENVIEGDTVGIILFGIGLVVIIVRAYLGDWEWNREKARQAAEAARAETAQK